MSSGVAFFRWYGLMGFAAVVLFLLTTQAGPPEGHEKMRWYDYLHVMVLWPLVMFWVVRFYLRRWTDDE